MIMNVWSCTESDTISLSAHGEALLMDGGEEQRPHPVKKELGLYAQDGLDHPYRQSEVGAGADFSSSSLSMVDATEQILAQDRLLISNSGLINFIDTNGTTTTTTAAGPAATFMSSPTGGPRVVRSGTTMQVGTGMQQLRGSIIVKYDSGQSGYGEGSVHQNGGASHHQLISPDLAHNRHRSTTG
jgi:hypothetical protein